VRLYGKAYPDGAHLGRIGNFEELTTDEFKQRLKDGAFKKPPVDKTPENSAPVAPAPAQPKPRPAASSKPQTLVAFLRKLGGIKDQGGELTARNTHRAHPGLVNNKRGMTLDDARQAAAEAGYLSPQNGIPPGMSLTDAAMADTTTNDLLAALDNHPHYAIGVERPSTDPRDDFDHVVESIHRSLGDMGVRPELRDPELIAEAAHIALKEGLDPDHAYESAIARSIEDDREERAAIDQDGDIPWEDYGSSAAVAPDGRGAEIDHTGRQDEGPSAQGENPAGREERPSPRDGGQGAQEGQQHGTAPEVTRKPGWQKIGVNKRGNPVWEDERGVRSYTEKGIRVSESVRVTPGSTAISVDPESRGGGFQAGRTGRARRRGQAADRHPGRRADQRGRAGPARRRQAAQAQRPAKGRRRPVRR
jgi:hypothetical protein